MNLPPRWRTPAPWMLLGAALLSLSVLRPLARELGVGLVLGFVSERPVAWMLRRAKRDGDAWRWGAAGAFAVGVVLVVAIPGVVALWVALRELVKLVTTANLGAISQASTTALAWLRGRLGAADIALPMDDLGTRLEATLTTTGAAVARGAGSALSATPGALFSAVVVLVAWVTFTVTGRGLRDAVLPAVLPWPREREILRRVTAEVVDGVVVANVGVAAVQAAVVSLALALTRVPHALVWGVGSFALSFVPLVGTAMVTVGAALYLFAVGRRGAAVAMLVVAVVAGSIDNVLRPALARGSTELPFLWMMVSLVGGVTAFGLAGVVVGPLSLAWTVALWHALRDDEEPRAPAP